MAWRRLPGARRGPQEGRPVIAGIIKPPAPIAAPMAPYAAPMAKHAARMGRVVKPTIAAAKSRVAVMENAALQVRAAAAAAAPYAAPEANHAAGMGQVVRPIIAAAKTSSAVRERAATLARTRPAAPAATAAYAAPTVGYAATASASKQSPAQAMAVVVRVRVEANSSPAIERAPVTRQFSRVIVNGFDRGSNSQFIPLLAELDLQEESFIEEISENWRPRA